MPPLYKILTLNIYYTPFVKYHQKIVALLYNKDLTRRLVAYIIFNEMETLISVMIKIADITLLAVCFGFALLCLGVMLAVVISEIDMKMKKFKQRDNNI